jgi:hypothetical protein
MLAAAPLAIIFAGTILPPAGLVKAGPEAEHVRHFVVEEDRSPTTSGTAAFPRSTTSLGPGFIDGDRPAADLVEVQIPNGVGGLGTVSHLDECETTGPTRLAVLDDVHFRHFAVLAKRLAEVILGGRMRQIAHVDTRHEALL